MSTVCARQPVLDKVWLCTSSMCLQNLQVLTRPANAFAHSLLSCLHVCGAGAVPYSNAVLHNLGSPYRWQLTTQNTMLLTVQHTHSSIATSNGSREHRKQSTSTAWKSKLRARERRQCFYLKQV